MNTQQTIDRFLEFFIEHEHQRLRGTSIVPPDPYDPVLYVSSGMHSLIPYLQGREHPQGRRLCNVQRCLRTTDLGEVGDETHLTVFEMLGSWSLGDYSHPRSLRWGYQLLTEGFGLSPGHLSVTVFGGNKRYPEDDSSRRVFEELGVPVTLGESENWWTGPDGMCGPDCEIFVWTGSGSPSTDPFSDERWVEVWNHVQMRYREQPGGRLVELPRPCVDTGMGLERLLMVLQGVSCIYETDLWRGWQRTVQGFGLPERSQRLLCDHLRSLVVLSGDGVFPSNSGRGYVPRRLLRRVLSEMWSVDERLTLEGIPEQPIYETLEHIGRPEVPIRQVTDMLESEERRFRSLLERARILVPRHLSGRRPSREDYLFLHDTHGLPRELVDRLLEETS